MFSVGFTSLQQNLSLREQEDRFGSLVAFGQLYGALLSLIAEAPFGGEPVLIEPLREQLRSLARSASTVQQFSQITTIHSAAIQRLEEFYVTGSDLLKTKDEALQSLLGVVNQAAAQFLGHHAQYSNRVGSTQAGLTDALRSSSMMTMRAKVQSESQQLSASMEFMEREANANVAMLRAQVADYRAKLQMAEEMASTDSLTGLANRREGEGQIEKAIQSKATFCLLFMDLNGFKRINDQYGHACGDQVLVSFGKNLKRWFRPTDVVSRWGGDEFLVVMMGAGLEEANRKCADLRKHTMGSYRVVMGGKIQNVDVKAAIGLAQWQDGESAEALVERADQAAYSDKPGQRSN